MSKHFRIERGPSQKPPRPLSTVDVALPSDLEDLVLFLRGVRDEIDGGRIDDDMMRVVADELVKRAGGVALIVRGGYGIEASLGLRLEQPLFRREQFLRCAWNIVAPEARNTGHAKSLILKAREFADTIGRPLQIEEFVDLESGKAKLVGRHIPQAGAIYLHAPQSVEAA